MPPTQKKQARRVGERRELYQLLRTQEGRPISIIHCQKADVHMVCSPGIRQLHRMDAFWDRFHGIYLIRPDALFVASLVATIVEERPPEQRVVVDLTKMDQERAHQACHGIFGWIELEV